MPYVLHLQHATRLFALFRLVEAATENIIRSSLASFALGVPATRQGTFIDDTMIKSKCHHTAAPSYHAVRIDHVHRSSEIVHDVSYNIRSVTIEYTAYSRLIRLIVLLFHMYCPLFLPSASPLSGQHAFVI